MYFDNYKQQREAKFNPGLFWEYNLSDFDFNEQVHLVVQRVIVRGGSEDIFALFNLYGKDAVEKTIREIPAFSQRDIEFISNVFGIPYRELKSYNNMVDMPGLWPHRGTEIRI